MAVHMSVRLAWHSDGWNGHICKYHVKMYIVSDNIPIREN